MLTCALVLSMDLLSKFHVHSMDCGQVGHHNTNDITMMSSYLVRAPVLVVVAAKSVWYQVKGQQNKHTHEH